MKLPFCNFSCNYGPFLNIPMRLHPKFTSSRAFLTTVMILASFAGRLVAQEVYVPTFEDTLEVYEGLFMKDEPLHLTLTFNLKEFRKSRRDEKYQPAEMTCVVDSSFQVTHPVRVRARGIYRRDNCTVPPFWLNIRFSGIEADSLHDVTKFKMVVRCRDSKQYESYILREYLVYKIYNLITPVSYRVRLVRLKLVDTGKENRESEDWAFLIEPDELMEKRLHGRMIKSDRLSMNTVNPEIMDRVALFSYMIGNSDYSVTGRHNLRIIALEDPGRAPGFLPIPYDFDYTGLVNTTYATPGDALGIHTVRERYYLGPCRDEETEKQTVRDFSVYQEGMIKIIRDCKYLDERDKEDMIGYISSYYKEAERDDFVRQRILSTCKSY
jgi:hypothetical protein